MCCSVGAGLWGQGELLKPSPNGAQGASSELVLRVAVIPLNRIRMIFDDFLVLRVMLL